MVLNTTLNASAEKSKKQLVYEYLKNQIISNELPPGTLLVERQLCTMLDASRTPIREAIQQLVSENLVTSIPTKGCFVSEVRYEDIAQLYDVREYLEKLAGKLCSQNILPAQLHNLRELATTMTQKLEEGDLDTFYETDTEFHLNLIRYSRNTFLIGSYESLYPQILRITYLIHSVPSGLSEADCYHLKIVDALENHDPQDAEYQIGEHIRICKANYLKLFAPNLY